MSATQVSIVKIVIPLFNFLSSVCASATLIYAEKFFLVCRKSAQS